MTSAKVICDSVSPEGIRLTTMEVKFHRFILAEFNTHRVFSRNFRSSRAVPVKKLLQEVRTDPAMPVFWGKNQPGMQAAEELDDSDFWWRGRVLSPMATAKAKWKQAAATAAIYAEELADIGLHKQIANRVLEPFLWVHGVVTATEWDNFFGLRLHKDAQPEMRALAVAMWDAFKASTPELVEPGSEMFNWHLPYIKGYIDDREFLPPGNREGLTPCDQVIRVSAARCARVSYNSFDTGKRSTVEEDLRLFKDKLAGQQPFHASPLEHQATPDIYIHTAMQPEGFPEHIREWGNFKGWRQFRKMISGEAVAPLPEEYCDSGVLK